MSKQVYNQTALLADVGNDKTCLRSLAAQFEKRGWRESSVFFYDFAVVSRVDVNTLYWLGARDPEVERHLDVPQ